MGGRVAGMRTALAASASLLALSFVAGCGGDEGNGTATGASAEPASFAGVPWKLVSGLDVEGVEASPPSVTFENGVMGGSTGCNHYGGPVTIDGDSMKIGMIAATQIACPPPADSVERAYLAALGQVGGWGMDGSALVLVNGDGDELLRYEAASPIGDWEATSIQTGDALASPLPGTTITAKFANDGTLSGSAGCNSYTTPYTLDGGEIEIAPPAATKKACAAPDGVMEQEAAYLAALPSATHFRADGGTLALLAADGTYVASYVPAG
jgi:heat shock protein HslJ